MRPLIFIHTHLILSKFEQNSNLNNEHKHISNEMLQKQMETRRIITSLEFISPKIYSKMDY